MIAIFDGPNGKYAELHQYQEPTRDDDGMPCGYNEIWEVYIFPNKPSLYDVADFKTNTYLSELNARLFLKMNGYKEIVL